MGYLTAKQLSEKWEISERRIVKLCNENRINGAIKNGMVWLIPEDTIKPSDKRNKVSKYINTQKRIMIINFDNSIGYLLIPLLQKEGYIVEGMYNENVNSEVDIQSWKVDYEKKDEIITVLEDMNKYYEHLIFIDIGNKIIKNKDLIIKEFAKKMNCESAIILVNDSSKARTKLEEKLSKKLIEDIGVRINALNITAPLEKDIIINYSEIAEDVLGLITKFKNTTGINITTDGGYLELNKDRRTKHLDIGRFYRAIISYFKALNKESYMWCASTMLEDEWTEEPLEMNFRVNNLESANRGANIERIFIFSKSKIKEFKENKTLKIYMQSNVKTMFVDLDEVRSREPELLEIVGEGWDGIDKTTLLVDLPVGDEKRGYISKNKDEVNKAYNCFQSLKKYAKDLKEILK